MLGPIVRINPDELHIRDPDYYGTVYAGGGRRVDKYIGSVAAYTVPRSTIATVSHDTHRARRAMLSPYFSRTATTALEPLVHERIDRLCERFEECRSKGAVIDLDGAFAAMTCDVINAYFYGRHEDLLGSGEFKFAVRDAIVGLVEFYHVTRFLPALASAIKKLPIPVLRMIQPGAAHLLQSEVDMKEAIKAALLEDAKEGPEGATRSRSVILSALRDPHLPAEENDIDRLVDEGTTIIFAGTETTARTLSTTMFYLLRDKTILARLRGELASLAPGPPEEYTYSKLEALPYLVSILTPQK